MHFEHWLSHPLSRLERRPFLTLLGITLIAAIIRFTHLSSPCIWADEAEVYMRTCGTYGQLLDQLRTDGFTPLHYEMHWVIGRVFGIKPTPFVLRFVPAICGVLMIPAIYFLARQLVDRSTSLLAALLAAGSAYLIYYSRDAKMYGEAWLMVTLFSACLFWWFRSRSLTPWLCWVAAATAGVGIHASSAVIVGLSLLFLLTQSKLTWTFGLAWFAGVAVVMAGPAVYYGIFNQFTTRAEENWKDNSGLDWVYNVLNTIDWTTNSRVPIPGYVRWRQVGSAYEIGWEWSGNAYRRFPQKPDEFWHHPINWISKEASQTRAWISEQRYVLSTDSVAILLIAGMIPWPRRWRGVEGPRPQYRWRAMLWISAWIFVPLYVFHAVSMTYFGWPTDLLTLFARRTGVDRRPYGWGVPVGFIAAVGIVAGFRYRRTRQATTRLLITLLTAIILVALLEGVGRVMRPLGAAAEQAGHGWHPLWVPRYMGFVLPAIVVAVAVLFRRLPTVYLRCFAVVLFLSINLTVAYGRVFGRTEPPTDLIAADEYASAKSANHHVIAWFTNPRGGIGPGGGNLDSESGRYYLQMIAWQQPMTPTHFKNSSTDYRIEQGTPEVWIPRMVASDARIREVIIWNRFDGSEPSPRRGADETDRILKKLPGWKLQSDVSFPVRIFWDDRDAGRYRRRFYVRG